MLNSAENMGVIFMAKQFHIALGDLIMNISERYKDLPVVLAGGVFQNRTLMEEILGRAGEQKIIFPQKIPQNDASISLGQIWKTIISNSAERF
jgi:hydrogenase maturation protein HypF